MENFKVGEVLGHFMMLPTNGLFLQNFEFWPLFNVDHFDNFVILRWSKVVKIKNYWLKWQQFKSGQKVVKIEKWSKIAQIWSMILSVQKWSKLKSGLKWSKFKVVFKN